MREIDRKLVLDTETTGLKVDEGDRIIEIGIIELIDNIKTGKNYHIYLNPEKKIDKNAEKIHGLNNEFLESKPKFFEIALDLINYISSSTLIIHNAEFDKKFLDFELENCGFKVLDNQIIDTLSIARKEYPGQSVSLDALCRKLKIDNSAREKHGALLDAELLSSVFLEMTEGKQTLLEFEESKYDDNNKLLKLSSIKKNFTREKITYLPKDELESHQKFIKTINNSIWNNFGEN